MAAEGLDPDWYVTRHRTEDEVLPWDHIAAGLHKDFLWQDWRGVAERARSARLSLDPVLRLRRLHRLRARARCRRLGSARRRQPRNRPGPRSRRRSPRDHHPDTPRASAIMKGDTGFPVRVRFTKRGKVRFVGHRDVARAFERAFRIEQLPLSFTLGFSPRPKVSFGLALGVGHESLAEYLDVELAQPVDVEALVPALSAALPVNHERTASLNERAPALNNRDHSRQADGVQAHAGGARGDRIPLRGAEAVSDAVALNHSYVTEADTPRRAALSSSPDLRSQSNRISAPIRNTR